MDDTEFYYCAACEADSCDCGGGFYAHDDDEVEPECPCCGNMDVQP